MTTTLSLEDLEKYSNSVYEAIIIVAKRARQINEEQKRLIEQVTGGVDESEGSDDEEDYQERDLSSVMNLPKPTTLALQEFLSGKLKYEYGVEDEYK